ncbi:MAG: PDZ domain-containing protein, partial [Desulfurococcaceae archaeon]
AYRSGIREGDIIVKANNRPLRRTSELRETIEESIERGYVVLEIIRGGTKRVIEVEIIVEEL